MSKYHIKSDDKDVSICLGDDCNYFDGFIDIFVNDDATPSPFKTISDATLFAEVIIKLLEVVT